MVKVRVIAIDGPAGSGKTTVAKALAARLGLEYLNTGAMYRAVTSAVLRANVDPFDKESVAQIARTVDIAVDGDQVTVNGIDVSTEIRGSAVTGAVSAIAANPEVRTEMVALQRDWTHRRGGGVLEGRDIGTVVFPNADFKIFLVVDRAEGARRRAIQDGMSATAGSDTAAIAEVAAGLAHRDKIDSTREAAPLKMATDAVSVDTTGRTCDETIELVMDLFMRHVTPESSNDP